MSTTVGNGLTVDGTVKASQATQAGEAVVLGDDGMIPASMVASGGGKVITEYKSISDFYNAIQNGKIPIGSEVFIYSYCGEMYGVSFLKCTGALPWPVIGGTNPDANVANISIPVSLYEISTSKLFFYYYSIGGSRVGSLSIGSSSSSSSIKFSKAIVISEES